MASAVGAEPLGRRAEQIDKVMEKRALIAITLSVGVLLAWQLWVGTSTPPPRPDAPEAPAPAATAPAPSADAPASKAGAAPRAAVAAASVAEVVSPSTRRASPPTAA